MKRKYFTLLSLLSIFLLFSFSEKLSENKGVVVLELFTSQGCSSCPLADEVLDKIQETYKNDNVFALSYHVDYWNYIGWKDPFAKKTHTQKQRSYAVKFRDSRVYTPELVVNGQEHFVGSNETKMHQKVKTYLKSSVNEAISMENIQRSGSKVHFDYKFSGTSLARKLRVVLVIDERITQVKRGENRNRTLKNTNIVVNEFYLDVIAESGSLVINIPDVVVEDDVLHLMMIVENETTDILGATKEKI